MSTGKVLGTMTAADANELLVDRAAIGMTDNQFDRQTVSISDPSGGSATSAIFDRYVPHPKLHFHLAAGDAANWFLEPPSYLDPTPGDPLGVDTPETYALKLHEQAPAGACTTAMVSDSTVQTGLIPRRTNPYTLNYDTTSGVWQGITYKYLYDGKGLVAFAFNRRGTNQFRWYDPGTSTAEGLPVDATDTGPFSLTVN